ncbi:anti sigma-E protein, RseA [Polaromonas sp. OV174]|uniref:sigma-E factor negative regulatory protein n=1 Tax=Polaromonas sp. OV174 TaxID=1855300 RepID=UPI0008EDC29B|nr:sigma-E factor negative regulatory protein [Polaromonas sp. OV174]SFB78700.1 anti sigma-E protein, RseA [Polaromonas sp. OV174]
MNPSMQTPELMSALVDGQLERDELAAALQACQHDESALSSWSTYHLIGDVLRAPGHSAAPVTVAAEREFVSQLNRRLAQEAPLASALGAAEPVAAVPIIKAVPASHSLQRRGPASNDGNFRWKLVAGLASLAAISAIAWNTSGLLPAAPQLAQAPGGAQQVLVASPQGPMVRDARLEELLAAHKQLGATFALQEPSGFLLNTTFEMPQAAGR